MIYNFLKRFKGRRSTRPSAIQQIPADVTRSLPLHSSPSTILPSITSMFELTHTQWEFGDWDSLVMLTASDLQHDPERARIALLIATAHQQKNNDAAAQEFLRLAKEWGCPPKYIARILISGTYNTLGKAAVLSNQTEKAFELFKTAMESACPNKDISLLAMVRSQFQLGQDAFANNSANLSHPRVSQQQTLNLDQVPSAKDLTVASSKDHEPSSTIKQADLTSLRDDIRATVKTELSKTAKQLEAFINIHSYLANGEIVPELHGWPVSPDFALYLIGLVRTGEYDIIVEFGSGTSTCLIARALQKVYELSVPRTKQIAFEHLEAYHSKTLSELSQRNLTKYVDLELSPLVPYNSPDGTNYLYYDCHEFLESISSKIELKNPKILILVDGPPGSTGKHARYPAFPIIDAYFPRAIMDFVLDDYDRPDERAVLKKWVESIQNTHDYTITEKKFEKGACVLSAKRKSTF